MLQFQLATLCFTHGVALFQVENSKAPDHKIAASVQEKLGETSGVSYSEIASRAIERGRKELAILVSDQWLNSCLFINWSSKVLVDEVEKANLLPCSLQT